jgi:hypothetical protein
VSDQHTTFGQDQLDIAQAEAEHVVQPHGMADDLGWEAMAMIRTGLGCRPVSFAGLPSGRQLQLTWQCRCKVCNLSPGTWPPTVSAATVPCTLPLLPDVKHRTSYYLKNAKKSPFLPLRLKYCRTVHG